MVILALSWMILAYRLPSPLKSCVSSGMSTLFRRNHCGDTTCPIDLMYEPLVTVRYSTANEPYSCRMRTCTECKIGPSAPARTCTMRRGMGPVHRNTFQRAYPDAHERATVAPGGDGDGGNTVSIGTGVCVVGGRARGNSVAREVVDGNADGSTAGLPEGDVEGDSVGVADGDTDGVTGIEGSIDIDTEAVGEAEGEDEGEGVEIVSTQAA